MKYSLKRLQSYIQEPLPSVDELKEKIIFHAFEVESIENRGGDTVLDIKVLPDRASDCFSHRGMAREIARICNLIFFDKQQHSFNYELKKESVSILSQDVYSYHLIRMNIKAKQKTPFWMEEYLNTLGQRSINLFVDSANTVMFDIGQPIHIFDAHKVKGAVVVRESVDGERILLLTGEEIILSQGIIVIADDEGPLALAGIKGGKRAEVDSETTQLLVEVANFNPSRIRKSARMLRLHTDASKRFENTVPLVYAEDAISNITSYINTLAEGEILSSFSFSQELVKKEISFTTEDIRQLLGKWMTDEMIKKILPQTGWEYAEAADFYTLSIPFDRPDISGVHDIAEDLGKLIGYEKAGALEELPFVLNVCHDTLYVYAQAVRTFFLEKGYSEVYTYSFTKKGVVEIAYGPKDKSALRTNLMDDLVLAYEKNKLHVPLLMVDHVCIFEIGTVFLGEKSGVFQEEIRVAWKSSTDCGEMSLVDFIKKENTDLQRRASVSLSHRKPFKEWSPYPCIVRDVAFWILQKEGEESLEVLAQTFAKQYCIVPARIFDRFEKEGKVSVAYRFVFQSYEKTLTDEEVETYMTVFLKTIDSSLFTIR